MKVVRPRLPEDTRKEIARYLAAHWERAKNGRATQVDGDYARWDKVYRGEPLEKTRSWPWPNASNIVVPLARMHLDTFVARTMGTVFATTPLVQIIGFPTEHSDALEKYLDYKALFHWSMYRTARAYISSGVKNGTAVIKTPWIHDTATDVSGSDDEPVETEVDLYHGPRPEVIPFEDFYVYPHTATAPHQVQIKFHRVRFTGEDVKERCEAGKFLLPFESESSFGGESTPGLKQFLKSPSDVKRSEEESSAGIVDPMLDELHVVECEFKYSIQGKVYYLTAQLVDETEILIDCFHNPYPRNINIYEDYKPYPREGLWYGESMVQLLEALQEECSTMHNDRRNNATIANSPVFKKKSSSLIPNPSANRWYPGKVFEVDETTDFEAVQIGRNYSDTVQEEGYSMSLAERLIGQGAATMAAGAGSMGKRGVYSSQGTMAILSEGNERSHTNVRDFRECLSGVLKTSFVLQKAFNPEDPAIAFFPPKDQEAIRAAMEYANESRTHLCPFTVRTSSSAANKEVERTNLMQMAGVLERYNGMVQQVGTQLLDEKLNPGLRLIYNDILGTMKNFSKRLLRAFDEMDPEGVLPDVAAAIESVIPGGSQGTRSDDPLYAGGNPGDSGALSREGLEGFQQIPFLAEGGNRGAAA